MKKNYLNIILTLAFIGIAYLFLFVPTWFHEQGHIREAGKQGIDFYFQFYGFTLGSLLGVAPVGEAIPSSAEDCEKFNSLALENKQKITHAGVFPSIFAFTIIYSFSILLFSKFKFPKWWWFIILFLYFLFVLSTVWGNIFSPNLLNDWHIVNIPNCSLFG